MELIIKYLEVMLLLYIFVGFVHLAITVSLGYWDKKMKAIEEVLSYLPMTDIGMLLAKITVRITTIIYLVLFWGPQIFLQIREEI